MSPPVSSDDTLSRIELAVGGLRRTLSDVVSAESTLARRFSEEKASETRLHALALESIRTEAADARSAARAEADRDLADAEATHAEALRRLAQEERYTRTDVEERAEQRRLELTKLLEEAVWVAETVYEGAENQPRIEAERAREALAAQAGDLKDVREEAVRRIRRCRQQVPETPPPDAARLGSGLASPESGVVMALGLARNQSLAFASLRVAGLFRGPILLPPALGMLLAGAGVGFLLRGAIGAEPMPAIAAGAALGGVAFLLLATSLWFKARNEVRVAWLPLAESLAVGEACVAAAEKRIVAERARRERELVATRDREITRARARFEPLLAANEEQRRRRIARLEEAVPQKREKRDRERDAAIESAERTRRERLERADRDETERLAAEEDRHAGRVAALAEEETGSFAALAADLLAAWAGHGAVLRAAAEEDRTLYPPWSDPAWDGWTPSSARPEPVRFGSLAFDAGRDAAGLPADPRLAVEPPTSFTLPAAIGFPHRASLFVETDGAGRERAVGLLQATLLRLLARVPPGKLRLTIVDPVGLGQGFAGFMHLADEDEKLVGDRIWTDPRHVEQRLLDLTEHMETVIQKYLRNEFPSIEAYNERAGEIAEPFRYLVVCDFPHAFSDVAAKRLVSILASGSRCGVHVLLHRDRRVALPEGIGEDDLARAGVLVRQDGERFAVAGPELASLRFEPDPAPPAETLIGLVRKVGKAAKAAGRVEVPFAAIAPRDEEWWTESSAKRLRVPLGRAGATRIQHLTLGEGTSQHALIAGKTGSGKSTLLHAMITSVACRYAPHEVEFWLVDFKKGVEFMTYATHRLPHARAVAVESDREFGLSVLQGLDAELKRRGDLFRSVGVQDLASFRAARPDEPMPRSLLVIDEFQELFVEDDKVGQDSALLLDRLVRQGRAFGMHVILGSQTLGGAYSIARATMGQMGVRIALQCSEADSQLILSDDNAAARLLSRPGEAIYNDAGGLLEGNSPFQVVWLPDPVREKYLAVAAERAAARPAPGPATIVFEGNVPADPATNAPLGRLRATRPSAAVPAAWLGEAIAIKDPTACPFRRQGGANLLLVGQQDEAACGTVAGALVSLAAQVPAVDGAFTLLDGTPADDPRAGVLARTLAAVAPAATVVPYRESEEAIRLLAAEVERRQREPEGNAPAFLVIHGLQRFRALRKAEDDYSFAASDAPPSAATLLAAILRDGPPVGVHAIVQCDTLANLQRTLDRNTQREFDWRVLFQVSATDSSTLIDSPAASRLGPQRALLFSEELGTIEKFRPWKVPDEAFLAALGGPAR